MKNVARDADDLPRFITHHQHQSLSEGFFVRKDLAREQFADNQHFGALANLLFGEVAAAQQWNSHRAEIVLVYAPKIRVESVDHIHGRAALDGERHVIWLAAQRQFGHHSGGFNSRQPGYATFDLLEEICGLLWGSIFLARQVHAHRQHILRIEARTYLLQLHETSNEQS